MIQNRWKPHEAHAGRGPRTRRPPASRRVLLGLTSIRRHIRTEGGDLLQGPVGPPFRGVAEAAWGGREQRNECGPQERRTFHLQQFKPVTNLPSPARLFISRARLVTGDRTVGGPGENRFRQCGFFVLSSGRLSAESPAMRSGLRSRRPFTGLVAPGPCIDSIGKLCPAAAAASRRNNLDFESERES